MSYAENTEVRPKYSYLIVITGGHSCVKVEFAAQKCKCINESYVS